MQELFVLPRAKVSEHLPKSLWTSKQSFENATAEMKLKMEISPKLFYQVYAPIFPCENVPNMCTASRADDSTQDAPDLFSSGIHFLLQIPFFLFSVFPILYFSTFYSIISIQFFFWRELNQSHNLPDLLDWSFSRSVYWFSLFSILQCLGGRKLPQYCVVCHLKDWTHPGSKNWIGLSSRFHRHNSKTGHNFKHNLQC